MRLLSMILLLTIGCGEEAATPTGQVGHACVEDTDCKQVGATCVKESQNPKWVGGYCVIRDCPTPATCPSGTFCQMGGTALGGTTCLDTCATTDDCRTGYRCCPSTAPTGGMVCAPPMTGNLCP